MPTLLWINGLSDGPGFFFVLVSTLMAWLCLQRRTTWMLAALGVSLAVTVTFRAAMLPAVLWLWTVVAYRRGWRAALIVTGAASVVYIPQAAYNQAAFGLPAPAANLPIRYS